MLGQHLHIVRASTVPEIDAAFAALQQARAEALIIGTDPFFNARRDQFIALAQRYALPTIFDLREFVTAGGLLSYGGSLAETYRLAGIYTGKILKGARPSDLPVLQPTKFELVVNLRAARAIGLTIPQSILSRADDVIE